MATYGGAVDLILTELARSDTSITAVAERELLKAIDYYSSTRFWFNEAKASFTVSNTIYYSIGTIFPATATHMAGFLEFDQLTANVTGGIVELDQKTHQEIQRMDLSGITGQPCHWALYAEMLRIYPKAASGVTYQVDVFGVRKLATLSASTESNAWTNEALNLVTARAQKNMCARKFRDFDSAQIYQLAEDQELQKLLGRTELYTTTGKVSPGY